MESSIKELSQYRFERAKEDYETAEVNLNDGGCGNLRKQVVHTGNGKAEETGNLCLLQQV